MCVLFLNMPHTYFTSPSWYSLAWSCSTWKQGGCDAMLMVAYQVLSPSFPNIVYCTFSEFPTTTTKTVAVTQRSWSLTKCSPLLFRTLSIAHFLYFQQQQQQQTRKDKPKLKCTTFWSLTLFDCKSHAETMTMGTDIKLLSLHSYNGIYTSQA